MDKYFVSLFAGRYLEKHETITPTDLNLYIAGDEAVGKTIDDKVIKEVLEDLVTAGWLEIYQSDEINPVYNRYVTEAEKKKLRNGRH